MAWDRRGFDKRARAKCYVRWRQNTTWRGLSGTSRFSKREKDFSRIHSLRGPWSVLMCLEQKSSVVDESEPWESKKTTAQTPPPPFKVAFPLSWKTGIDAF